MALTIPPCHHLSIMHFDIFNNKKTIVLEVIIVIFSRITVFLMMKMQGSKLMHLNKLRPNFSHKNGKSLSNFEGRVLFTTEILFCVTL